jgi:uncharacterized protein YndB with AHSA1/START domain
MEASSAGSDLKRGSTVDVDVVTEIDIARPREEVAGYVMDPDNATDWYRNIKKVEWKSQPPLRQGSRVAFVAQFLGRTIAYTYDIKEFVPHERLIMATDEGPFAMETTYSFTDSPGGGTSMKLRNRGRPSGFGKLAAPMMAAAMRRANTKDLEKLKSILE